MYDAREALIPGSAYDRSNTGTFFIFLVYSTISWAVCASSTQLMMHLFIDMVSC